MTDCRNLSEAKKRLLEITVAEVYSMYQTQPLADEIIINQTLKRYAEKLAVIESKLECIPDEEISKHLAEVKNFLQTEVSGKNFIRQRDKIAKYLVNKILGLTEGADSVYANRGFWHRYIKAIKGAYYDKRSQTGL